MPMTESLPVRETLPGSPGIAGNTIPSMSAEDQGSPHGGDAED
jgi:hypothetical protein